MGMLEECADRHPDTFRLLPNFDPTTARLLYAGSDFVLVPSLYEPCGLTQLMAMRYGSVPVVRRTGGLADTVEDNDTGISFEHASGDACAAAIRRALTLYANPEDYKAIQTRAMNADFSWDRAQGAYAMLYDEITS